MDSKAQLPTARHRELADQLKGGMSYAQHYAYLLDWYMNDRNGWNPKGGPEAKGASAEDHVKESLKDVLDSLKHLDRRIDRVSGCMAAVNSRGARRGNLFTRLVSWRTDAA
jgi:hypothetical protein